MRNESLFPLRNISPTSALRIFSAHGIARFTTRRFAFVCSTLCLVIFSLWLSVEQRPRAWATGEVPIAFWAWRSSAPSAAEVERVRAATGMRALFLRAGQFDYANNTLARIRPVAGTFPHNIELHLVYNATDHALDAFAQREPEEFAPLIADTYLKDCERAANDGARPAGLQLDLDIPTRLLPRYAELLNRLRPRLPADTQLSITGLPTWLTAPALHTVLAATDFWVPQFYGDRVPRRLADRTPIADAPTLPRDLTRTRRLNHPFYAGLAAYGYALLYTSGGKLLSLRGDISPALFARDTRLRMIERRPVEHADDEGTRAQTSSAKTPTAWRYTFRATRDTTIEGMSVRAGESLVIEHPTAAGLRLMARTVRRESGDDLRGVCLFRLPATDDPTTLSAAEVAAALADRDAHISTALHISKTNAPAEHSLTLSAENTGTDAALVGDEAFTITLNIPRGSLHTVAGFDGFTAAETLCTTTDTTGDALNIKPQELRPCSPRRADALRLSAPAWAVGEQANARIVFGDSLPSDITAEVSLSDVTGQQSRNRAVLNLTHDTP